MRTLLVYALNPEVGIIKQTFSNISVTLSEPGMELLTTDKQYDLLRTGIGLDRAFSAVERIPYPRNYDQVIHFGVSGSLTDDLPVRTIVQAQQFSALNRPTIKLSSPRLPKIRSVTFFSSTTVVTDEATRQTASSGGAQAVDMESYAIADFCIKHNLPLIALRIISDRAGSSTPEEFRSNFKAASRELQKYIIRQMLVGD